MQIKQCLREVGRTGRPSGVLFCVFPAARIASFCATWPPRRPPGAPLSTHVIPSCDAISTPWAQFPEVIEFATGARRTGERLIVSTPPRSTVARARPVVAAVQSDESARTQHEGGDVALTPSPSLHGSSTRVHRRGAARRGKGARSRRNLRVRFPFRDALVTVRIRRTAIPHPVCRAVASCTTARARGPQGRDIRVCFPACNLTELDVFHSLSLGPPAVPQSCTFPIFPVLLRSGGLCPDLRAHRRYAPARPPRALSVWSARGDLSWQPASPGFRTATTYSRSCSRLWTPRWTDLGATRMDDQTSEASMEQRKR